MIPPDNRCPLDGAPLREWTVPVNSDPTYVHTDGTAHGGLLELAEKWDAALPRLGSLVTALRPQMEAQSRAGLALARALICSSYPPPKRGMKADLVLIDNCPDGARPTTED